MIHEKNLLRLANELPLKNRVVIIGILSANSMTKREADYR